MVPVLYALIRGRRMRTAATLLATVAFAAACKDSTVNLSIVDHVVVTPATPNITVGQSMALTATAMNSSGGVVPGVTISWSSSDNAVATVNAAGVVTANTIGVATIIASASGISGSAQISAVAASNAGPAFNHVFVVGLLQQNYATVFPASGASPMPYLDSLAKANGLATKYYGNVQPSIGNFFMLAVGDTVTNDDNNTTIYTGDNIVRQLIAAGKTWKSYAEDIPSAGYMGADYHLYSRHHNVFVLLSDVANDPAQRQNVVPLTQLSADITAGALPNYGMIVPNECHNSHQCTLGEVDTWLRATVAPLIASAQFQQDGMLVILFDRSNTSVTNGGGQTAFVVVSPKARPGTRSSTIFQHQSTLRLTLNALGIGMGNQGSTSTPGLSTIAPDMLTEFFTP